MTVKKTKEYNVSGSPPPGKIYDRARKLWGVDFDKGIIFTYGDMIYSKFGLTEDLRVHERTHVRQQKAFKGSFIKDGKDAWWDKYFTDAEFRLSQELEAYKNQARWIKNNIADRNQRFQMIRKIANDLGSPIYGSIISQNEAWKILFSC